MTVSMRVLSAGKGYRYLLKTVAAGDGDRDMYTPLTRSYTEAGTPDRWLGTGLAGLGGVLGVGDEVTEAQLRRLLGQGRDPVTGAALGRAYPRYRTIAERVEAQTARLDPELSDEARAVEVERITTEEAGRGRPRTVAGFDFTFSVPKSVSTLWAVADGGTQALIVQAHHTAIAEVIELVERDVAATRTGAGGVADLQDEAERWFVRACYVEEWASSDTGRTRSWARYEFARWCDRQGRRGQAAALRQLLVDEASRESLTSSRWMRSEWKRYREDWQFERDRESARHDALQASLAEHTGTPLLRQRLVTVLCDNYFLGDEDAPLVQEYLASTPGGVGFRRQLRQRVLGEHDGAEPLRERERERAGEGDGEDADRAAITAMLWWLLRDFQSSWLELLGLGDEAESFRRALDDEAASQGHDAVLGRVEEFAGAKRIVRERLLGGDRPPIGTPDQVKPFHVGWSNALGLAGTTQHYAGQLWEMPALRGTALGMSLWLAGEEAPLRALDALDRELDELVATVQAALARLAAPESRDERTGHSASLGEIEAERLRDGFVRGHLRAQRAEFEALVGRLTH